MTMVEERTYCPRHPKIETALRCASCGTLICYKCLVPTPVGSKCKTCASQQSSALFRPSSIQAAAAAVVALAAGAFAGWAVQFGGFYILFVAVAYGGFVAEVILRASGRKRGIRMEIITGSGMLLGAVGGRLIVAGLLLASDSAAHPPYGIWSVLIYLVSPTPVPLLALVVAIGSAISRIRYL